MEKNKLRLVMFKDCNRSCEGCCNQYWDLDNIPTVQSFKGYDEVLLTGGEPMLKPSLILDTVQRIKKENRKAKILMYTAKVDDFIIFPLLCFLDGITLTLHEQDDVISFEEFEYYLNIFANEWKDKSFRLNIFKGINLNYKLESYWKIKDNMEWDTECPLPNGEVLMKL